MKNDTNAPVEGGYITNEHAAAVRVVQISDKRHMLIDAPRGEVAFRLGDKPVFFAIPFGLTWGVGGGFSHEAFIGIGMKWSPSKYVTATAQSRFGTFFFNHGTRLRSIGVDLNVPTSHETWPTGYRRQNKYVVFGAEYYRRDVAKWGGFMKGSQWYASGQGVAFRVAIRSHSWSFGA